MKNSSKTKMGAGFYSRLALDGIRKNKQLYLPYLLTCIGMVMMTYIMGYLRCSGHIYAPGNGETVIGFMNIGLVVLILFSLIFLFYTHSFLLRRRKKEFGLYHILGMDKRNLSRLLLCETLLVGGLALSAGLFWGITFSKLAELGFVHLLKGPVNYSFSISFESILLTALPFAGIFLLLLLNALRQIWFSSTVSLLRSESAGEKPPKANWVLGILGILLLVTAYYMAVTIQDPVSAVTAFAFAVLLVIIATYLLLIAGSVLLCRILQKHKRYYYHPNHFVSVSSLVYRMKRNGAGLASICILATMVLVTISSTSALFIGGESSIQQRFPRHINYWFASTRVEISEEDWQTITDQVDATLAEHSLTPTAKQRYRYASLTVLWNGGDCIYNSPDIYQHDWNGRSDIVTVYFVSLSDYNALTGQQKVLSPGEALLYCRRLRYDGAQLGFRGAQQYRIKEQVECFPFGELQSAYTPVAMLVVPDLSLACASLSREDGNSLTDQRWIYAFDTDPELDAKEAEALCEQLRLSLTQLEYYADMNFFGSVDTRAQNRVAFFALYGGLFYLGILLSIVFLFAAVLMIYYKQISEGFEDQARFEIMQKVGMTKKDIKRSINSQLLTVFFLPLLLAGSHLIFAFPIIEKLLLLFQLSDHRLFLCTTVGSYLVFAFFYVIVYRITANAYYRIVSEDPAKKEKM